MTATESRNEQKTAIFLSVREKATRLPRKVLREVAGQTLTGHLVDRLQLAGEPDLIVVCTSVHPDDTVLCDIALKKGVHYFRGSEEDKLQRYLDAARAFGVDFFCVVDGDDFLVSEEHIDLAVRRYRQTGADYITTAALPLGAASFGLRTEALEEVMRLKQESDTEVWCGYFTEGDRFHVETLEVTEELYRWPELRLTLDYEEDLELVTRVFEATYAGEPPSFRRIMEFLRANPELAKINEGAQAGFEEHIRKSPPVRMREREKHPWAKALVIGLGSMGKRRTRCLLELGAGAVAGFDPRDDRREEAREKYGVETFEDIDKALAWDPNLMVISTPPDLHHVYATMAAERGIHFFVEAGILDQGAQELMDLARRNGALAAPSCTMRYFPGPKKVKELLQSGVVGKPLTFSFHSGQHLEDWHPWESIKDFYVSNPETGACREIVPFELMWLTDVFGPFGKVTGLRGRYGSLDVEIDDAYHVLLETEDGKVGGHLLVEVLSRPYIRRLRVVCSGGSIEWDQNQRLVRWCTTADEVDWQTCWLDTDAKYERACVNPEEPYIEEIEAVLLAAQGKASYPVTFLDEARILGWLYRSEEESDRIRSHG